MGFTTMNVPSDSPNSDLKIGWADTTSDRPLFILLICCAQSVGNSRNPLDRNYCFFGRNSRKVINIVAVAGQNERQMVAGGPGRAPSHPLLFILHSRLSTSHILTEILELPSWRLSECFENSGHTGCAVKILVSQKIAHSGGWEKMIPNCAHHAITDQLGPLREPWGRICYVLNHWWPSSGDRQGSWYALLKSLRSRSLVERTCPSPGTNEILQA